MSAPRRPPAAVLPAGVVLRAMAVQRTVAVLRAMTVLRAVAVLLAMALAPVAAFPLAADAQGTDAPGTDAPGVTAPGADAQSPAGAPAEERPAGAAPAASPAPAIRLEVGVDRQAITIGDPIAVTLTLTYPEGVRITSFTPEASLGALALLGRAGEPAVTGPGGTRVERRTLRVTAYELGRFEIPAFEAAWEDGGGRTGTAVSRPIPFSVASVLPPGDEQPADIKPPAEMPERRVWPFVVAGLLAAAAALAWWLQRRRRAPRAEPAAPPEPAMPADERAYLELERLLASGMLERGEVKPFYIELVEILRRYLEARFGVETFERTSEEILEALRVARLPLRPYTATAEFFGACDLVKFAKYLPEADETRATVERAYRLIDETRPPGQAAAGRPGAGGAGAGSAGAGTAGADRPGADRAGARGDRAAGAAS